MYKKWLIGFIMAFSLGAAVVWQYWPQPQIGRVSFQQIQEGMRAEQVERIIGLPPGDYYTGPRGIGGMMSRGPIGYTLEERGVPSAQIPEAWYTASERQQKTGCVKAWWGNDFAIYVAFDETDQAVSWRLLKVMPTVHGPNMFGRLRRWLGW